MCTTALPAVREMLAYVNPFRRMFALTESPGRKDPMSGVGAPSR
jgi:hypothetical protein